MLVKSELLTSCLWVIRNNAQWQSACTSYNLTAVVLFHAEIPAVILFQGCELWSGMMEQKFLGDLLVLRNDHCLCERYLSHKKIILQFKERNILHDNIKFSRFFLLRLWLTVSCLFPVIYVTAGLCMDPLDKGKCSASIPRYYYNTTSKTCEEFIYSGCGGSNNNFVSKQTCMDVCVKGVEAWVRNERSLWLPSETKHANVKIHQSEKWL